MLRPSTPLLLAVAAASALSAAAPVRADKIFPFAVHESRLDNGLKVVAIPYDSPGIVAYVTVVRTGSRDEVEPGHSGFAHFFEHMMFGGTERFDKDAYNDVLKRMGADSNAFTSDDRTIYYIIGPSAELDTMMDLEADRFLHLEYSEEDFRREALAVLGEYNKNISNPFLPMFERMRALAFTTHTYGHTTMGFLDDIKAMPGYYDYSLSFFDRFYRPENSILLVVGDVDPERLVEQAKSYYGGWEPGYQAPKVAAEPPQEKSAEDHLDWPSPISPHLMAGYRAPAFSDSAAHSAALGVIGQLLFGEAAPLYQKLVVEEQWVDSIGGSYSEHRDPYLFTVFGRIKSKELLPKVRRAIDEEIARLQQKTIDPERLETVKSHLRYDFALGLDSPGSVAFTIANYLVLTGDPESVNRTFERYAAVTAEDVRRVAREVFKPANRTVVTLSHPTDAAAEAAAGD